MAELDDYLTQTLRSAPELNQAPWAAVPTSRQSAFDGNTQMNAQAAGHVINMTAHRKAVAKTKEHHGNIFERTLLSAYNHLTGRSLTPEKLAQANVDPQYRDTLIQQQGVATPPSWANPENAQGIPLREVQHQYRALRDIYERQGIGAGLTATALVAGGAAGGAFLGGGQGAVLGGEATAGILERTAFKESWDRTADGEAYRDGMGRLVSPGRDVAHLLGLSDGTLGYNALSAVGDGLFDLTADPLAAGAGLAHGVNATEHAAGGLLGQWRGDTVLRSVDDVDRLLTGARANRTAALFDDIARKQAAEIADQYPRFQSIARDLGEASSREDVAQVFRDALQGPELLGRALPTASRAAPIGETLTANAADDTPIGRLAAFKRRATTKIPMVVDPDTLKFEMRKIDPVRNDNFDAVRAALKFGKLPDRVIDGVMNDYINAVDTGQRRLIFRNAMVRSVLSTGVGEDSQLVARLRQTVADEMGGISGAEGAHYAFNLAGQPISSLPTQAGGMTTAAMYMGQRGDLALPEFKAWLRATREAQGGKALFGRLDDWTYGRLIVPFKSLALLTGGFALRVSTAELIPAALRNGVLDTIRASAAARAATYGERLDNEELGHVQAAVAKLLRGPTGVLAKKEDVELATDLIMQNRGHIVAPAVRAGDYVHNDAIGKLEADSHNIYALAHDSPGWRETNQFKGFGQGERDQPLYWQRAVREVASDPGQQAAAAAYRDAYISAGRERVEPGRAGGFIETTSRGVGEEPVRALPSGTVTAGQDVGAEVAPVSEAVAAGGRTAKYTDDELVKIATRAAVRADEEWLRQLDPQILSDFTRSTWAGQEGADPILEWARQRVEGMKALTHAPTRNAAGEIVGAPHLDILDNIANGDAPDIKRLEGIAIGDRPLAVKGRVRVPDVAPNLVEKVAAVGFKRVLDPIINTVGREHQYLLSVKKFMGAYDDMIAAGQLTRDEALYQSQIKAIQDVARFIHNPSERTQFSVLTRNIAPFWFAQEQSYRRVGRLLATDPAAFRRYQIMVSAFTDFVHEQHDAQGFAHFVIPGLGFLDETMVGAMADHGLPIAGAVPTQVLGNVDSLQTLFPFAEGVKPSFSPIVTIPGHILEGIFPEARPVVTDVIGGAANSGSTWDQLMPNTPLRNLIKSFGNSRTISSGMASTFAALAYQQNVAMQKWVEKGGSPDDPNAPHIIPTANATPKEKKQFIEKLRNQTRVQQIFRALFSAVSPTAPTIDVGDYGIKQDIQRYIDKYGYFDGTQRYLAKNPNATPYTITHSRGADDAPTIAPTRMAQAFYHEHESLFDDYAAAAGYLIPQDQQGNFDSSVYQEQIALGLREVKSLHDFEEDFYVNEGFMRYQADKAIHDAAVASLGDDNESVSAENASWSDYLSNALAKQNPVWWNYFTSQDRENRRANEIDQLRSLVQDPRTPQTTQVAGIQGLIGDLDTHLAALEDGRIDGWSSDERQAEIDSWQAYLDAMSEQRPELSLVIGRLFSHLGGR